MTSFNFTDDSNDPQSPYQNQVKSVVKFRRKADFVRYERPVPGDRVMMDACKIGAAYISTHPLMIALATES